MQVTKIQSLKDRNGVKNMQMVTKKKFSPDSNGQHADAANGKVWPLP